MGIARKLQSPALKEHSRIRQCRHGFERKERSPPAFAGRLLPVIYTFTRIIEAHTPGIYAGPKREGCKCVTGFVKTRFERHTLDRAAPKGMPGLVIENDT